MSFSVHRLMWSSYGHGFAHNLRLVRTGRGISQQALAEMAGMSRTQISNLERNENGQRSMADPQLSTVYKLALALEVPPATLLPGVAELVAEICEPRGSASEAGESGAVLSPHHVRPFPKSYVEQRRFAARPWE
ncbi:helix-turn-helix transcriptional regulator [uncultured Corynebacterium sp.]|uniref:helix-turn-helix domain-containing protein n=1 Tax=uncultured Corynebacterium sp. TaxID=159447 RepID=UPI0025D2FB19|nr:helix-turn-helix transcriptional regulator [uncultured Corynebacterium sp.]